MVNVASPRAANTPMAAMGNAEDVDQAVQAARAAFNDRAWRQMDPVERSKVL
jgi:acyl-CoA reductase-like NAD-dependent aldehyde dehydrogenase